MNRCRLPLFNLNNVEKWHLALYLFIYLFLFFFKVFRYSSAEDRLELCLEPYGHFPVEPNIEQKVKDSGLHREQSTSREEVKFGSSGAIHHGHERKAFSGELVLFSCWGIPRVPCPAQLAQW